MPELKACLIIVAVFLAATVQGADRSIYTWTDERGNLHMTDEPPPSTAKVKEVETYQEPSPEALESIERAREQRLTQRSLEEQRQVAAEAQRQAVAAQESAATAAARAQELTSEAQEYVRRFGNTPERRKQFKYKIQAKKEMALAAQEAARAAAERAEQARLDAQKVSAAVEEAQNQPPPLKPEDLKITE